MNKVYVAIDLKSFYASVECVELGLKLTEDEMSELNANLNRLLDSLDERPQISVTYFVPDEKSRVVSMWKSSVWCGYMTAMPMNLCSRTVCG